MQIMRYQTHRNKGLKKNGSKMVDRGNTAGVKGTSKLKKDEERFLKCR